VRNDEIIAVRGREQCSVSIVGIAALQQWQKRARAEANGAAELVSMFYSCRAFPVSGNNGGHGSPLPAPWPFSVAFENRARTGWGACRFGGKYVSRLVGRPVARVQRSAPKNSDWNLAARGKRVALGGLARWVSRHEIPWNARRLHTFRANDRPS